MGSNGSNSFAGDSLQFPFAFAEGGNEFGGNGAIFLGGSGGTVGSGSMNISSYGAGGAGGGGARTIDSSGFQGSNGGCSFLLIKLFI
jgi:hypothetical protein